LHARAKAVSAFTPRKPFGAWARPAPRFTPQSHLAPLRPRRTRRSRLGPRSRWAPFRTSGRRRTVPSRSRCSCRRRAKSTRRSSRRRESSSCRHTAAIPRHRRTGRPGMCRSPASRRTRRLRSRIGIRGFRTWRARMARHRPARDTYRRCCTSRKADTRRSPTVLRSHRPRIRIRRRPSGRFAERIGCTRTRLRRRSIRKALGPHRHRIQAQRRCHSPRSTRRSHRPGPRTCRPGNPHTSWDSSQGSSPMNKTHHPAPARCCRTC
jgi:hypothetical protein